jgi:hypothetical protein
MLRTSQWQRFENQEKSISSSSGSEKPTPPPTRLPAPLPLPPPSSAAATKAAVAATAAVPALKSPLGRLPSYPSTEAGSPVRQPPPPCPPRTPAKVKLSRVWTFIRRWFLGQYSIYLTRRRREMKKYGIISKEAPTIFNLFPGPVVIKQMMSTCSV